MDSAKTKTNDQKDSLPKPSLKTSPTQPSSSAAPLVESLGAKEGEAEAPVDNESTAVTAAKGSKDSSSKTATKPPTSSSSSPPAPAAGAPTSAGVHADSEAHKKFRRAERFGMRVQLSEEEKRSSRAQRFGASSSHGSGETTKSEDDKRKARAERFTITSWFGLPAKTAEDEEAKKKARLARFAPAPKVDPPEEDKRKARAVRFAKPASAENPEANGQAKTEMLGPVG